MWLFAILVAVPIIEIALFIEVGGAIGTWPTIGIIILTAFVGTLLLRRQGLAALRNFQARLESGEDPGLLIAEGVMILVAGLLLLTPGFFTDAIGFALLAPPVRRAVWAMIRARVRISGVTIRTGPAAGAGQPGTVDGEFEEVDPERSRREQNDARRIDRP